MSPFDERREAILNDALLAADRRRRVRVAKKAVAAGCVFAMVAGAVVVMNARRVSTNQIVKDSPAPTTSVAPPTTKVAAPKSPLIAIQYIRDEDVKPAWQTITDDELLAELADAGRPSGIVRLNGKEMVVPQFVTKADAPRSPSHPDPRTRPPS